jgi:hypothetical protein
MENKEFFGWYLLDDQFGRPHKIESWNGLFACPFCGTGYVHMRCVEVARGQEHTVIDASGTRLMAGAPPGSGASIAILLWCENGHRWWRVLQFHKGQTFWEDQRLLDDEGLSDACELWRD